MVSSIFVAGAALVVWFIYSVFSGYRRNILKARKTDIQYLIVPAHPFNPLWQITYKLWVPLIKLLPKSCWEDWMFIMIPNWEYDTRQQHFERLGTESFIILSPWDMSLFTNSAELIHQITCRREAFIKDTARYGVLNLFGLNILTTDGAVWRMHRKTTSASFNEKNAAHTFAEAINQTNGLMSIYFGSEGQTRSTKTITTLEKDVMTWALNIIGYVGFGLRLLWPGQKPAKDADPKTVKYGSVDPPPGFTMSFGQSLGIVLERIIALLVIPWPILRILPFHFAKEVWAAKEDYVKYMEEFLRLKIDDAKQGNKEKEGMDIMGQLARSSYAVDASKKDGGKLKDSEIIGNAFIMSVAGHETTANTVHFTLVYLAMNPAAQRRLQQDIDGLFKGAEPATWDYDKVVNPMLASYIGACINETLRLIPPVTQMPKMVSPDSDQVVTIDGNKHVLPAGMSITLVSLCVQRNPHWWPTKTSVRTGASTDLDDYLPERWYRATKTEESGEELDQEEETEEGGDEGGYQGSNTSAAMYRPVRGSFIPFSDGPRSCLGRRIAMVEMIAALAVIFQKFSIELAVDEWATDEEVEKMSAEEKRTVYTKAQRKATETLDKATTILTLKLNDGIYVPVSYESLRKSDLELQLDEFLADNASQFQSDPKFASYYTSRARTAGSPVKKDPELKVVRRRATKAAEEIVASPDDDDDSSPSTAVASATNALIQTPGRALSLASRIPLPPTPADIAQAVDRRTLAVRERVTSLYEESGITERTQATRESLSTVTSVLFAIAAFELYYLRPELLPNRYAFTVPAIKALGTNDYPVFIPDMFNLLTSSFWSPALTWAFTSIVLPSLFGYFFNLSAGNAGTHGGRGRPRSGYTEYTVDPLTFSIVKGLITYVVYAQGATLGGWIDPDAVSRINLALYSGWKGVLVGSGVAGLAAIYDAALKK
ncbi:cytochrome P450 [Apodospora peruviana]|uniref:Cytochrome P450 n=1 Tax=Apodospora peruviana TaxID=516989 RepID=A0AAE0IK01_9PEZI|nr:cytochrome P450 [Apodospora peruviana]